MPPLFLGAAEDLAAAVDSLLLWSHSRNTANWRGLELLERDCARIAAEAPRLLPAFHALLLPLPVALQYRIAAFHTAALLAEATSAKNPPAADALPRRSLPPTRGKLSVSVLRAAVNQNLERVASLLALDSRHFAPAVLYSAFDAAALGALARHPSMGGLRHVRLHSDDNDAACQLSRANCAPGSSEGVGGVCQLLVDASGHTSGSRLGVLARRPCAVVVAALGFASSYGGGLVDYLLADRAVLSPTLPVRGLLPERAALLPHTYQVTPLLSERIWSLQPQLSSALADSGDELRSGLGCFLRENRLHPSSWTLWTGVLLHMPRRSLWLLLEREARRNLGAEAALAGIARRRLLALTYSAEKASHLRRHRTLAIMLDSAPLYGAHTTASVRMRCQTCPVHSCSPSPHPSRPPSPHSTAFHNLP